MKGEKTILCKPFRYGGIMHDYNKTVEDWLGIINPLCYCCGGDMTTNLYTRGGHLLKISYPYASMFKITKGHYKGNYKLETLCRACAYDYGMGVIEMDGETYYNYYDFNEHKYKKTLKEGKK